MDPESSPPPKDARAYVGEFIGTYLLVLTVGANVLTGSPVWAVTSIACTLMVSIYALGAVSGANFNPAVSFALGLLKQLAWNDVGIYICMQLLGGIFAGLTYGVTLWKVFNLAPTPGFEWYQAGLAEFFYTFLLVFVVLNTAVKSKNEYFGLAIGFSVVAGGYGAGHISGGCFNPAVAFGIDVSSAGIGFGWCLVYTLFELAGAGLAVALFNQLKQVDLEYSRNQALLSEFLGTFMLVLTVGLNVIGGSKAPVFSIAASLMCMIYALGDVSGANFNPAVTLAIYVTKRENVLKSSYVPYYMVAQVVGGICAGFTYFFMEGGKSFPLAPGKGYNLIQAGVAETIFTFLLCYVVLCVATTSSQTGCKLEHYYGLAIGSCVTAGGYAIGAVSGGSLNPAVSIGIAAPHLINGGTTYALAYIVCEFVGGFLAAVLFANTHREELSKPEDRQVGH